MTTTGARRFLPASGGARRLVSVSFIDSIGTGLYLAGSALFFTQVVGLSAVQIGIGQSLFGLAGLLGMVPVGRLADRVGGKRVVVAMYLGQAVCFAALFFVRDAWQYFILSALIGVAEWGTSPIVRGLVGAMEGEQSRVRTMSFIAMVRNLGFTIGGLLVALTALVGTKGAYAVLMLGNAASFVVGAVVLALMSVPAVRIPGKARRDATTARPDLRFRLLSGLSGGMALNGVLLSVGLPVWIATKTAAPPMMVGAVLVINTVLVIALQVVLSRGDDSAMGGARAQRWAARCLAGCCLAIAFTRDLGGPLAIALIAVAAILLTLGEMWNSIGAWRVSYALAPEDRRTYYLSVFELGRTGATTAGPILVTSLVIGGGAVGWLCLMVFFLVIGEAIVSVTSRAR